MSRTLRPLLPPGVPLLRRDRDSVQIGAHPGIIIRARPGVVELLRLLNGARTLERLQELLLAEVPEFAGHVRDVLWPLIHGGAILPHRPRKVRLPTWTVDHDPAASDFAQLVRRGLDANPPPHLTEPELRLVISTGEPHRLIAESLVGASQSHLLITLDGPRVHLGPLVIPGVTPCLNCYDQHRAALEPHWQVFVPQFGRSRLELGVDVSDQFRAVSQLRRGLLAEATAAGFLASRVTIHPEHLEPQREHFGFHSSCHCHLLAA